MGFGSFTLGYLLGQSFQNPQDIIETPGKCQADYDNDNDPELRAYGEECYWRAWDKACKEKVIERLRNPNDDLRFSPVTYPDISKEKWADLIESGEVKIVAPTKGSGSGLNYIWADETREEAQREGYKQGDSYVKSIIANGTYRIVN